MRIARKMKRSTKQYITVCVIAVFIATFAAIVISYRIIDSIKKDYARQISVYAEEINNNKRMVYCAKEDLKAGDVITQDNIEYLSLFTSQPQESYISVTDIGKTVLIDISKGTHILKSMITDINIDDGIREVEFDSIMISSNIIENDVVDVRIFFPNGEDYCVLSKKVIKDYNGESPNCFFWLSEEELIRMHNAIVDAYLFSGSYLYTTKYIESNLQEATVVNYTPSIQAIELIKNNPNIVVKASATLSKEVRMALENRLIQSMNKNLSEHDIENNYLYPYFIRRTTEEVISETDSTQETLNDSLKENPYDDSKDNTNDTEQQPIIQDEVIETGEHDWIDIIEESAADLGYNEVYPSSYFIALSED